jgi:DNA-binding cell septation regulator SpoVG
MKINRMTKGEWSKIRAFFDLETEDGFILKGFKLVEGISGLFVVFPNQKNKDGEYQDTVFANKVLKQKVNQIALDYYNDVPVGSGTVIEASNQSDEIPF